MNLCKFWKHRNRFSLSTFLASVLIRSHHCRSHHCVTLATNSATAVARRTTSIHSNPNARIFGETTVPFSTTRSNSNCCYNEIMTTEEKKYPDAFMANADDIDSDEEAANAFCAQLDQTTSSSDLGKGWSSGQHDPTMFPLTRDGRLQLYSSNRRWIGLNKGWSRVGAEGTNQFSHRTRRSSQMKSLIAVGANATLEERQKMLQAEALGCRSLIAQLCEQYYQFGWATGTAGGVSIRVGGPSENRPWRIFVAPSGIQKGELEKMNLRRKNEECYDFCCRIPLYLTIDVS